MRADYGTASRGAMLDALRAFPEYRILHHIVDINWVWWKRMRDLLERVEAGALDGLTVQVMKCMPARAAVHPARHDPGDPGRRNPEWAAAIFLGADGAAARSVVRRRPFANGLRVGAEQPLGAPRLVGLFSSEIQEPGRTIF